jgi:hypothetical protein
VISSFYNVYFVHGLFNGTVSVAQTIQRRIERCWGMMWKEAVCAKFEIPPQICLQKLRKNTRTSVTLVGVQDQSRTSRVPNISQLNCLLSQRDRCKCVLLRKISLQKPYLFPLKLHAASFLRNVDSNLRNYTASNPRGI